MSTSKIFNRLHFLEVIYSSIFHAQMKKLPLVFLSAVIVALMASTASAQTCKFVGGPQFGGIEPPLSVDAMCVDPDYNDKTMVIDSTIEKSLKIADGSTISYREVHGHFPALRTKAQLPEGILGSPTTAR